MLHNCFTAPVRDELKMLVDSVIDTIQHEQDNQAFQKITRNEETVQKQTNKRKPLKC